MKIYLNILLGINPPIFFGFSHCYTSFLCIQIINLSFIHGFLLPCHRLIPFSMLHEMILYMHYHKDCLYGYRIPMLHILLTFLTFLYSYTGFLYLYVLHFPLNTFLVSFLKSIILALHSYLNKIPS